MSADPATATVYAEIAHTITSVKTIECKLDDREYTIVNLNGAITYICKVNTTPPEITITTQIKSDELDKLKEEYIPQGTIDSKPAPKDIKFLKYNKLINFSNNIKKKKNLFFFL